MIRNIRVHVHQANLGNQFTSLDAERYIDWLEPRLKAEFPGAKVVVNYGLSADIIEADTTDEARDVEYTIHLLWNGFQLGRPSTSLQSHAKGPRYRLLR